MTGDQDPCPVCKHPSFDLVLGRVGPVRGAVGPHDLVRCRSCGLARLRPLPSEEELAEQFDYDYSQWVTPRSMVGKAAVDIWYRWQARSVARLVPRGAAVLEIGCASGRLLALVQKAVGGPALGIEPNPEDAARARERYGLKVVAGPMDRCDLPDGEFDLVMMRYVLEHLRDPLGATGRAARLLKPGGRLLVWVPNLDSLESRLLGRYWDEIDVPRHPFVFSVRSLRGLFARSGLRVVRVGYSPEPNAWIKGIHWILERRVGAKRLAPAFVPANPLMMAAFLPLSVAAAILRASGRIRVVAERA